MNNKKTLLSLLLCLVLCTSLFAFPAFAEDTVIVIGGTVEQSAVSTVTYDATGSGNGTTVFSGYNSTPIQTSSPSNTAASGAVVIMPDGAVRQISSQPVQQAQNQIIYQDQGIQTSSAQASAASAPVVVPAQIQDSTPAVTSDEAPNDLALQILTLINETRAANGLSALRYSSALQGSADIRAMESVQNFSHLRPDGSGCETAVTVDYMVTGENLIQVTSEFATASIMLDTWMNSPTHRNNILLSSFSEVAVGVYVQNGITYVSTVFAGY